MIKYFVALGIAAAVLAAGFLSVNPQPRFGATILVDYKFWYIKRDDDVHISEAAVRFYSGAITTLNERKLDGTTGPVTRYRRTQRLASFPASFTNITTDSSGNPIVIFTPADFGVISTNDELRSFVNAKIQEVATQFGATVIAAES